MCPEMLFSIPLNQELEKEICFQKEYPEEYLSETYEVIKIQCRGIFIQQ